MGVKSFIKKSVAFVSALAMACSMVVMPVGVSHAAEAGTTDSNPNLVLDKNAKLQSDGTYTVTLEAYAKGRVETTPAVMKPCDIVLVLDQSGSMQWDFSGSDSNYANSRQKALRDAATNFIENVSKNAREQKVDHNIAIVSFNESASVKSKFVSLYSKSDSSQNSNAEQSLKNTIADLGEKPSGATRTDLGMEEANKLIQSENSSRNRVVVVFTDGYPTPSNGFNIGVADSAISYAKKLKDKKAKVYTIGIFGGANVSQVSGANSDEVGQSWEKGSSFLGIEYSTKGQDAAANRFLNYMSSNFNNTNSLGIKQYSKDFIIITKDYYEITTKYERDAEKYYMTASSTTELNNIFEKLSDEVSEGKTDITLDDTAVAKDVMSENFDLPANISNNVKVYTANYEGKDSNGNLKWSDEKLFSDAKVTSNSEEKSISVSGFNYGANYIVDGEGTVATSGKKLIIVIYGVTANKAGSNMDTNSSSSAIYDKDGGLVKAFRQPKQTIESKSYVLDYGKTVSTAAADYGVTSVAKANVGKPAPNGQLNGEYGTFAISNGALNYTPGKINWDGIDTGYVFGEKDAKTIAAETEEEKSGKDYSAYKWEEVNFIPASSVYYEDDFAKDTNEDSNVAIVWSKDGWTTDGTSDTDRTQSSENSVYGWETQYATDKGYSNGSAHQTSTKGARATFTFTGTGVDVYSRTNGAVGSIRAILYNGKTTENVNRISYRDNLSESGDYYQIPTLSFKDLDYGTYTVEIAVMPTKKDDGTYRSTYYLDGIRVYNPIDPNKTKDTSTVEGKAYDEAKESNAKYIELRDGLISQGFGTVGEDNQDGAVFIDKVKDETDKESTDVGEFTDYGPKHEVYLNKNQGVAFKISNYDPDVNKVFIGIKSLEGKDGKVEVTYGTSKTEIDITSSNDLYYNIVPDSNGNVVIRNTTNSNEKVVLSVTKVRITGNNTANMKLTNNTSLMSYAAKFDTLSLKEDNSDDNNTDLDKDDVTIENPSEDENTNTNSHNTFWQKIVSAVNKIFGKR